MYKYHCLNPIADIGLNNFTEDYTKIDTAEGADALLVRSAVMHDMEFDKNLRLLEERELELITSLWIHVRSRESLYSTHREQMQMV